MAPGVIRLELQALVEKILSPQRCDHTMVAGIAFRGAVVDNSILAVQVRETLYLCISVQRTRLILSVETVETHTCLTAKLQAKDRSAGKFLFDSPTPGMGIGILDILVDGPEAGAWECLRP